MGDIISFVARKKQSKLYNEGAQCAVCCACRHVDSLS